MAFLAAAAPVIGAVAGVAGAGISAFSHIQQGNFAGQVADNNAVVAKQNADYAIEAGTVDAGTQSMKGAAKSARIKTATAANGVDVNSGSAAAVEASQKGVNALDIDTILHNADLTAYGYTTQQKDFEAQADQDRTGGVLSAVGDVLGGIGSLAGDAPSLSLKWGIGKGNKVAPSSELAGYGTQT